MPARQVPVGGRGTSEGTGSPSGSWGTPTKHVQGAEMETNFYSAFYTMYMYLELTNGSTE